MGGLEHQLREYRLPTFGYVFGSFEGRGGHQVRGEKDVIGFDGRSQSGSGSSSVGYR